MCLSWTHKDSVLCIDHKHNIYCTRYLASSLTLIRGRIGSNLLWLFFHVSRAVDELYAKILFWFHIWFNISCERDTVGVDSPGMFRRIASRRLAPSLSLYRKPIDFFVLYKISIYEMKKTFLLFFCCTIKSTNFISRCSLMIAQSVRQRNLIFYEILADFEAHKKGNFMASFLIRIGKRSNFVFSYRQREATSINLGSAMLTPHFMTNRRTSFFF